MYCERIWKMFILMMGFTDPGEVRRKGVGGYMSVSRMYWMCWASETSPLYAMRVFSPTEKIRCMSLNRARLPKLAKHHVSHVQRSHTQVVCSQDDAIFVFHPQDTCSDNLGVLGMLYRSRMDRSLLGCRRGMEGWFDGLHWVYPLEEWRRHGVDEEGLRGRRNPPIWSHVQF